MLKHIIYLIQIDIKTENKELNKMTRENTFKRLTKQKLCEKVNQFGLKVGIPVEPI